jgi:TPP-dependent pyruvate/acetoin dehydrogenase alpha subunit
MENVPMPIETLSTTDHKKIYYYLYLTRYTDEVSMKKYKQGLLQETVHSCAGEEAIAIGSGILLRPDDYVLPSLRSRGYFFVKGITSNEMMAGLYGKVTGPARSKNTSHHMGDMKRGVVWGTGVIGSSIPLAVGVALGVKMAHRDSVVMTSFGDGASSRGDFHESLNMAAVWKLPVIFICENNGWAVSTPRSKQMAIDKISARAPGYGMPGVTVDGDNVLAVYEASETAIARARRGDGPTLLECVTHRWGGHHAKDRDDYRDRQEVEGYKQYCPVANYKRYLLDHNILNTEGISEIEIAAQKEVDAAVVYAEQSDYPSPEIVATTVYA